MSDKIDKAAVEFTRWLIKFEKDNSDMARVQDAESKLMDQLTVLMKQIKKEEE